MASGINTPEIVDGASQVPLSRSLGRARGHSTVLALADDAVLPSSSRTRRSSISKDGAGILDRDMSALPITPTSANAANGSHARPVRRESGMSVRSAYTVRGNGKQKQEELDRLDPQERGN